VLVLCLDTATADVAAAVVDIAVDVGADVGAGGTRTVATRIRRDARGAGEHLIPLALGALADGGAQLGDLGAVVVGLGPGPFTGLRAGVVTGAVLARTLGIPVYGVCSLDAYASPSVVVATDARRREVYWAAYDAAGVRVAGPAVDLPADLAATLAGRPVVGPGALLYPDLLGGAGPVADEPYPVARLASLAADRIRAGASSEVLVPLYLRRPDVTEPVAVQAVAAP
jgi:tRNA threonylcarbamoyl adenosine modification protein YeaZ